MADISETSHVTSIGLSKMFEPLAVESHSVNSVIDQAAPGSKTSISRTHPVPR